MELFWTLALVSYSVDRIYLLASTGKDGTENNNYFENQILTTIKISYHMHWDNSQQPNHVKIHDVFRILLHKNA